MPLTCGYCPATQESSKSLIWRIKLTLASSIVCPNCSNVLTISRADPSPKYPLGVNRFECRTCPYQYILKSGWSEKTPMKQKEVEDVFGGKEEFANADSIGSKWWMSALLAVWIKSLFCVQHNVLQRTAMETERTSSSCRFGVQMNLWLRSLRYVLLGIPLHMYADYADELVFLIVHHMRSKMAWKLIPFLPLLNSIFTSIPLLAATW